MDVYKELLLAMTKERSAQSLLDTVVNRLSKLEAVCLVRAWLVDSDHSCASCSVLPTCSKRDACLRLVASEPQGMVDDEALRIPLGSGPLGEAAATGEAIVDYSIKSSPKWTFLREWLDRGDIIGFLAQPLLFEGVRLGIIGCLLRQRLRPEDVDWFRIVADHAASTVVNARAFEEIKRLQEHLTAENVYLREEVLEARAYGEIVGHSHSLKALLRQIDLVAPTDASVLILGESGTGKELVAREIHKRSKRSKRPIIKVNCASIPAELYESEFFGHAKGSFTGASSAREGRFAAANTGTLFLDEVGEIPLALQSKLLRVLQEGQYERVGEEKTRTVDVRLIAATNRSLQDEIAAGRFRQDLFYRLNVFPLTIEPLRNRREDIPSLARHFLEHAAKKFHRQLPRLTQANILSLQSYNWPGNVRELQNVVERAVITSQDKNLLFDLPKESQSQQLLPSPLAEGQKLYTEEEFRQLEKKNILLALQRTDWKVYGQDGAAALLGIKPTTLTSRIKKYHLKRSS